MRTLLFVRGLAAIIVGLLVIVSLLLWDPISTLTLLLVYCITVLISACVLSVLKLAVPVTCILMCKFVEGSNQPYTKVDVWVWQCYSWFFYLTLIVIAAAMISPLFWSQLINPPVQLGLLSGSLIVKAAIRQMKTN